MLSFFETLVRPTEHITPGEPPKGLLRFYAFFLAQVKWYFVALLVVGLAQAAADAAIPIFIGRIVQLISHVNPADFFSNNWPALLWMIVIILVLRPLIVFVQGVVQHQIIVPGLTKPYTLAKPLACCPTKYCIFPE